MATPVVAISPDDVQVAPQSQQPQSQGISPDDVHVLPTMSAAPPQGAISKAVDAVSSTQVPGTGVTIGEAAHRAVDFGKIAGSEAATLFTGPEGLATKGLAAVGGKAAQMLAADPYDAELAQWVQKMGIPAEEAPGIIQKSLQAANGAAGKLFGDLTGFAEAYPHLAKAAKVAGIGAGGATTLYGLWQGLKNLASVAR